MQRTPQRWLDASRDRHQSPVELSDPRPTLTHVTAAAQPPTPGHAFVSYVHEDSALVDALQADLEASGIQVWRDKNDLWPGQDWKIEIKKAISTGSLAFIACFSANSEARETSYQNEELALAADQMRLRRPGKQWLFPVRFDAVDVPSYDLGAGRSLDNLQRSDLFGSGHNRSRLRLLTSIVRLLDASSSPVRQTEAYSEDPVGFMKATLLDPTKQIQLEDFVTTKTREVIDALNDRERFPIQLAPGAAEAHAIRNIAAQAANYWDATKPLAEVLVAGCRWGNETHTELWTRAVRSVAGRPMEISGNSALIELQRFPALSLVYAAALASVDKQKFSTLKAVAIDPVVRAAVTQEPVPVVSTIHPWRIVDNKVIASVLAMSQSDEISDDTIEKLRRGTASNRYTGVSDFLHLATERLFADQIVSPTEFEDLFDLTETHLCILAVDDQLQTQARSERGYRDGAWFGRSSWKHRHRFGSQGPEQRLTSDLADAGSSWPPLRAGLFGGSIERAQAALESFSADMQQVRSQRW